MDGTSNLTLLLQAINAFGIVGVLAFMLLAFYRGELIPKVILDRILAIYEKQLQEMAERILTRIDEININGSHM